MLFRSRVPRRTLLELLTAVAPGFRTVEAPGDQQAAEHPLRCEPLHLARGNVEIIAEDPPPSVVDVAPWRITTVGNSSRIFKTPEGGGPPVHIGTLTQGRLSRLSDLFGQQHVLHLLPDWIKKVERSERTRSVASAQLWRALRSAWGALGYIGGPELLLPPFFEVTIPADDASLRNPLPPGASRPRAGRYVVDFLHRDAGLQERARLLLANPNQSRSACWSFLVLTRASSLEKDSAALLSGRYLAIHTFAKGSLVAARKGSWSTGAPGAVQSAEDWTVWVSKSTAEAERSALAECLSSLAFSKDGVVPFDPSCPSVREAQRGASGAVYSEGGLIAATDGSVRKDGGMGAGVCWSRPSLPPISFVVHGPPKSVIPELAGLAEATETAPTDEPLTILTDSQASLLLLRGMQREDFPVFLHRRAEKCLLERVVHAINRRAEVGAQTCLRKVKAHSGEPLNTWADQLATAAADLDPTRTWLDPGAVTFYLHGRPVGWGPRLRQHLTEVAATSRLDTLRARRISRDQVAEVPPSQRALMNVCESWMIRDGMARSELGAALQHLATSGKKRRVLQTIGGTFPCQDNLYKWRLADSALCPLCSAAPEKIWHIQCCCRRLEGARTAAHHLVARCLWAEIAKRQRGPQADFLLREEVEVRDIREGEGIPMRCASSWDRLWAQFFAVPDMAALERLRPDAVAIRWDRKQLFLLEVTRAYDAYVGFGDRADRNKTCKYQPVVDRFNEVGHASGWSASVLPFTVGLRGSVDESAWAARLHSLDIRPVEVPLVLRAVVGAALAALDVVYDARSSILKEAS